MAVARARYIPSLLQTHLDDLAFIAGQRREALGSRLHSLREFGELNERMEAHLQGALHRDPTPRNALVRQRGGVPQVKVIDFGLPKALQRPFADRAELPAQGQILGTP